MAFGSEVGQVPEVVDQLMFLAKTYGVPLDSLAHKWEAMVPKTGDQAAAALAVLREAGLRSWSEYSEDVFAYELDRGTA